MAITPRLYHIPFIIEFGLVFKSIHDCSAFCNQLFEVELIDVVEQRYVNA